MNLKKRKTTSGAIRSGFNKNHLDFENGTNDKFILNTFQRKSQCRHEKCRNTDLKYAIDGFCIRCVQRVEYITREFPQIGGHRRNASATKK